MDKMILSNLPHEMILSILNACMDLDSARSLALSCHSLYAVFKAEEDQLCPRLLLGSGFDPELLHDALAVDESARHGFHMTTAWPKSQRRSLIDKVARIPLVVRLP